VNLVASLSVCDSQVEIAGAVECQVAGDWATIGRSVSTQMSCTQVLVTLRATSNQPVLPRSVGPWVYEPLVSS